MEISQKKAVVTKENRDESAKLKVLWEQRKRVHGLSQAEFGEKYGIGTQGAVSACLNGKMAISLKAGTGFAQGLRCDVSDFSPRLSNQAGAVAAAAFEALSNETVLEMPVVAKSSAGANLYPVKSTNVRPFDLFNYDDWMKLNPKDREEFENLIAGAILRVQKIRAAS